LPSLRNARALVCEFGSWTPWGRPVRGSKNLIGDSEPLQPTVRPSGETAIADTPSLLKGMEQVSLPSGRDQTRTVPSSPPARARSPSAVTHTPRTFPLIPASSLTRSFDSRSQTPAESLEVPTRTKLP